MVAAQPEDQRNAMKLRLRIGRQRAQPVDTDEMRAGSEPADRVQEPRPVSTAAPAPVPLPRTAGRRVVRVGSFCRVTDIGQAAVTETGRAVLAIRAGRCGRWVYEDDA
jgi:hypothetical protein